MAIARLKSTVKLRALGTGKSHALSEISIRNLSFVIDEPFERGGSNLGPTPTETALAALVGCTNVIAHKCAAAMGVDIGDLTIRAVCEFDRRGVTLTDEVAVPFQKIVLTVTADGSVSRDDLNRVAVETAKFCPLSKLFRQAGTIIEESWSPAR
ncbi:OsmC family protein [Nioella aestuarii]|uniref:OsmC family protein n=1 Tax=Nioella aestuarii TaxID=1662864 RepID=UPI003D7F9C6A